MDKQKVLDYIKRSGSLLTQAEKQASEHASKQAAVEALIPDVVEALIQSNQIPEQLRDKAAQQLKDPVKALEVLASVASYKGNEDLNNLGKAAAKSASSRLSVDSPYIGAREVGERESDINLLERFGVR